MGHSCPGITVFFQLFGDITNHFPGYTLDIPHSTRHTTSGVLEVFPTSVPGLFQETSAEGDASSGGAITSATDGLMFSPMNRINPTGWGKSR